MVDACALGCSGQKTVKLFCSDGSIGYDNRFKYSFEKEFFYLFTVP